MGIASFILGIASILCGICSFLWLALILGVVGIVLGAIARKNYEGGLATAGFILSIVGASLSILWLIACVAITAWIGNLLGSFI